jgi:hypothetical protein
MSPTASTRAEFADARFSEQTLAELLRALRARTTSHPVQPVAIAGWGSAKTRSGWALGRVGHVDRHMNAEAK